MILSTEMLREVVEKGSGWEAALIEAEAQIAEAEKLGLGNSEYELEVVG